MTNQRCVREFAAAVCAMQGVGLMVEGFKNHLEPSAMPVELLAAAASFHQRADALAAEAALLYAAAMAWLNEHPETRKEADSR
jgi:hypothetical protein